MILFMHPDLLVFGTMLAVWNVYIENNEWIITAFFTDSRVLCFLDQKILYQHNETITGEFEFLHHAGFGLSKKY